MKLNVYNTRIMGRKAAQRAEALASSKRPHGLWEASERFRGGNSRAQYCKVLPRTPLFLMCAVRVLVKVGEEMAQASRCKYADNLALKVGRWLKGV